MSNWDIDWDNLPVPQEPDNPGPYYTRKIQPGDTVQLKRDYTPWRWQTKPPSERYEDTPENRGINNALGISDENFNDRRDWSPIPAGTMGLVGKTAPSEGAMVRFHHPEYGQMDEWIDNRALQPQWAENTLPAMSPAEERYYTSSWGDVPNRLTDLVQRVHDSGGFSVDKDLNEAPASGYYASQYGGQEIPAAHFSPGHIMDAAKDAAQHYIGAWLENGIVYLDKSFRFDDLQEALNFGAQHQQQAIYDANTGNVIPVPGMERTSANGGTAFKYVVQNMGGTVVPGGGIDGVPAFTLSDGTTVELRMQSQRDPYSSNPNPTMFLVWIDVNPRGTGVGTQVMNLLKQYSDQTGLKLQVHMPADAAHPFYQKFDWLEHPSHYNFNYDPSKAPQSPPNATGGLPGTTASDWHEAGLESITERQSDWHESTHDKTSSVKLGSGMSKVGMAQPIDAATAQQLTQHVESLASQLRVPVRWVEGDGGYAAADSVEAPPIRTDTDYLVALHELGHHALYLDMNAMDRPGADWSIDYSHDPPLEDDEVNMDEEARSWQWAIEHSMIPVTQDMMNDARASIATYETPMVKRRGPAYDSVFPPSEGTTTKTSAQQVMYHVAPRSARESILANGLQQGTMVSPSSEVYNIMFNLPEGEGGRPEDAPFDTWEVNTDGLPMVEDDMEDFTVHAPIPPDRLRLLTDERTANLTPEEWHSVDDTWEQMPLKALLPDRACYETSADLARKHGWPQESGYYRGTGHYWNRKPDGTIVDASHDQFDENEPVRVVEPDDPAQAEYKRDERMSKVGASQVIYRGLTMPRLTDPSDPQAVLAELQAKQDYHGGLPFGNNWTTDRNVALRFALNQGTNMGRPRVTDPRQDIHGVVLEGHTDAPLQSLDNGYEPAVSHPGQFSKLIAHVHTLPAWQEGFGPGDRRRLRLQSQEPVASHEIPLSEGTTAKVSMAERSGDPQLDAFIAQYMPDAMTGLGQFGDLRIPENASGACGWIAHDFAVMAQRAGLQTEEAGDTPDQFGYADRTKPGFDEHHWVIVTTPSGRYGVDFTASQYGYSEFPMVQKLNEGGGWQRDFGTTAKVAGEWYDDDFTPPSDEEATTDHPNTMYHVTTNGKLNQGTSVGEYGWATYFFQDPEDAKIWASYFMHTTPQILSVNVKGLPLKWDAYGSGEPVGGGCSSTNGHAWRYEGDPSSLLTDERMSKMSMAWDFKTCPECGEPVDPENPGMCRNEQAHANHSWTGPGWEHPDLSEHSGQPFLYHGTRSTNRESIMQNGIEPRQPKHSDDQPAAVHFGTDPEEARAWAGPEGDVWKVDVRGVPGYTDAHSYNLNGEDDNYLTTRHIEPSRFQLHSGPVGTTAKVAGLKTAPWYTAPWYVNTEGNAVVGDFGQLHGAIGAEKGFQHKGDVDPEGNVTVYDLWSNANDEEPTPQDQDAVFNHVAPFIQGHLDVEPKLLRREDWGMTGGGAVLPGEPGYAPIDWKPGPAPKLATSAEYPLTGTPGWSSVPNHTMDWLNTNKPDEAFGQESDCINPKCEHNWTDEEQLDLAKYGDTICPDCGMMQNRNGTAGPIEDAENDSMTRGKPTNKLPGGGFARSGLPIIQMGNIGEKLVARAQTLPCGQVTHHFGGAGVYNNPVDFTTVDQHGNPWGVEVKTIDARSGPRFKLGGAGEVKKKVAYCQEHGLRQGLIGVRLNFYTDEADLFWRPQFTDPYLGDKTMTHVGTLNFADLNPFRDPATGDHHVPEQPQDIPF